MPSTFCQRARIVAGTTLGWRGWPRGGSCKFLRTRFWCVGGGCVVAACAACAVADAVPAGAASDAGTETAVASASASSSDKHDRSIMPDCRPPVFAGGDACSVVAPVLAPPHWGAPTRPRFVTSLSPLFCILVKAVDVRFLMNSRCYSMNNSSPECAILYEQEIARHVC